MTMTNSGMFNRREILQTAGLAAVALAGSAACAQLPLRRTARPELLRPVPLPQQVAVTEGYVDVPGARLWYWDTGGAGVPIVMAHAFTGSALFWGYQQPVFAAAGYRVIAWSRRNFAGTQILDPTPSTDVDVHEIDDLQRLVEALQLPRFHALGTAAGGGVMLRYVVAHPERVRTLVMACNAGGIQDEAFTAPVARIRPPGFLSWPPEFRELGPCYRAANPQGTAQWIELVKRSRTLPPPSAPGGNLPATALDGLRLPTLWLAGDADLYIPPPLVQMFADRVPDSESAVIDGSGHAAFWEQPDTFNRTVLDFLARRG